jgi:hypothetical protein
MNCEHKEAEAYDTDIVGVLAAPLCAETCQLTDTVTFSVEQQRGVLTLNCTGRTNVKLRLGKSSRFNMYRITRA